MMGFWIVAGVLTVLVIVGGLWPLLRGGRRLSAIEHAVAFYEQRQHELARQQARGEITEAERLAAEAEQARRLIALDRATGLKGGNASALVIRRRKLAALTLMLGIPALSLPVYLALGRPSMPDRPLASRKADPQNLAVADALRQIEAHLARNPGDGRGFDVVAPVYLRAGRFDDAARAYRRAIELLGETPARLADLGESLVASGNGVVSAEARAAFERSVRLDPAFAKSRFYLALGLEQDGKVAEAFKAYVALADELSDPAAQQRVMVEIERLQKSGTLPAGIPGPRSLSPAASPADAIATLPEAERAQAIRGMVEGLAARLEGGGGTLEEWQRLIRARTVLNERDKAAAHLEAARKALGGDADALAKLDQLARSVGLLPQP